MNQHHQIFEEAAQAWVELLLQQAALPYEQQGQNQELLAEWENLSQFAQALSVQSGFAHSWQPFLRAGIEGIHLQALLILWAAELDHGFEQRFAALLQNPKLLYPTPQLFLELLSLLGHAREEIHALFHQQGRFEQLHLIQWFDDCQGPTRPLRLSEMAKGLLMGQGIKPKALGERTRLVEPCTLADLQIDPEIHQSLPDLAEQMRQSMIQGQTGFFVELQGENQEDKLRLASFLMGQLGIPLIKLDFGSSAEAPASDWLEWVQSLAVLMQGALYLDCMELTDSQEQALVPWLEKWQEVGLILFVSNEMQSLPFKLSAYYRPLRLKVPTPSVKVRLSLWQSLLQGLPPETAQVAQELALYFSFNQERMIKALQAAHGFAISQHPESPQPTRQDLLEGCQSLSALHLGSIARRLETRWEIQDLVLTKTQQEEIQHALDQYRFQVQVREEWGIGHKQSYGQGMSLMFTGPSGTGKTMAAGIIAKQLGLPCYKIDLSQVVSKWVGETEKNLFRVFKEASRFNAVLFFDEADSLFGKRASVERSQDRYANTETSFLLQQMEEYPGIMILATNLQENMDHAFFRRMRLIIRFDKPNAATRLVLWQQAFPPQAPLAESVDFELLAKKLDLAGGNIRNIALSAGVKAAQAQSAITFEQILKSAEQECQKVGALFELSDFVSQKGGNAHYQ